MTNFARSQLRKPDVDEEVEPGDIVEIPPSVVETKSLLCAARLENSLDHAEFKALVDEFEASVRHDERMLAQLIPLDVGARDRMAAPSVRMKFMDAAGEAEVKKRYDVAPRTPNGKLKQGWAAMVGAELGYTVQQIQSCVHKLKHGDKHR